MTNVLNVLTYVMNTLVLPICAALLLAAAKVYIPRVLCFLEAKLQIQQDTAHNAALTNAMITYAGNTLELIRAQKYTFQDVKDGAVTADLVAYLNSTVAGAMLHFNKPPEDLNTMLVGKLSAMIGVSPTMAASVAVNSQAASGYVPVSMGQLAGQPGVSDVQIPKPPSIPSV